MPKPTVVVTRGVIVGSIIVAIVALTCVRLGLWQHQRLEQRRALNQATQERMHAPPARLSLINEDSTGLIYRRVLVSGDYDDAHTIIIAGRSLRGVPGVHVLTPLRLGGAAVLVNRGWMPSANAATIEVDSIREPGPRDLQALITPFPEDFGRPAAVDSFQPVWFQMNGARLRAQFGYRVMPYVVQILPHQGQPLYPIRLKPPPLDEGPHFGYMIQWFSFAVIAIVGWTALILRKKREQ